mmetsp:Transcript_12753/g.32228  ORF Transcript_12753/g.32228 Transcript_12753/m.32228 type:complete len:184 (-) Transcript_12753:76-627(-)
MGNSALQSHHAITPAFRFMHACMRVMQPVPAVPCGCNWCERSAPRYPWHARCWPRHGVAWAPLRLHIKAQRDSGGTCGGRRWWSRRGTNTDPKSNVASGQPSPRRNPGETMWQKAEGVIPPGIHKGVGNLFGRVVQECVDACALGANAECDDGGTLEVINEDWAEDFVGSVLQGGGGGLGCRM